MSDSYRQVCVEYMRPAQIRACREKADVAFLPLGAIEWHGIHGPIGLDALKAHGICCRAATLVGGGAVFPPLVWGVPRESFFVGVASNLGEVGEPAAAALGTEPARLRGFCAHGGMDVQEQWLFYQRLLRMSLEQIAGFGFRSIYVCAGHGPLTTFVRPVVIALARASEMAKLPVTIDFGGEHDAPGLTDLSDHAGPWETSLLMALEPDTVDLAEIERKPTYRDVGATPGADSSTREQGEKWAAACAQAIATEARWLVDNYPEQPARHRGPR